MHIGSLLKTITIFELILVISVNGFLDVELINTYLREKHIRHAAIVGCFNKNERVSLMKNMFLGERSILTLNLNSNNTDVLRSDYSRMGVILDADCDAYEFMEQCGLKNYFDDRHYWLILSADKNVNGIFAKIKLFINSDIEVAYFKTKDSNKTPGYTIEEVWNPGYTKGGELNRCVLGYYDVIDGYKVKEKGCRYWIRRNMTGVALKTIVVIPEPFEGTLMDYLNSEKDIYTNTFNRYHYKLLCNCREYYNFTFSISRSQSWGYETKDGTFDGMVGALERKLIDYGSSPLFLRTDRSKLIDYGRRTWNLKAAFIFRDPKSNSSADIFFTPLALSVWLVTVIAAIFVIIFLKFGHIYENESIHEHLECSWSYIILYTLGMFCQQGTTKTPTFLSGRITTFFLLLLSVIIYQFYSASLVSHLLMKAPTKVKTIEDLLKSELKVGCQDTLYDRDYFQYTTDKSSKDLYMKKILGKNNVSNFIQTDKGIEMVRRGGYAFHVDLASSYPIIQDTFSPKSICELREIQLYRTQPMHSNLQKNSPYKDMFDTCLHRLAEHGILRRQIAYWFAKKPACIQTGIMNINAIGLDYVYPALMFLAIGTFLSLLILCLEITAHYQNSMSVSKKSIKYPFLS